MLQDQDPVSILGIIDIYITLDRTTGALAWPDVAAKSNSFNVV